MADDLFARGSGAFPTTRWTLILSAKASATARAQALDALAATYWQPLYVFVRRKGLSPAAAQDLVQDLLALLIERDVLERLSPQRGRLRSFLRAAAANLMANQHERAAAKKRGGELAAVPLDVDLAERLAQEAPEDPDLAFDRQWATRVMDRALARLRDEYAQGERAGPVELLLEFFRAQEPPPYKDAAARYGMSVPQLKSFLHRARGRFRELLREEIAQTVERDEDVEDELRHIVEVLSA